MTRLEKWLRFGLVGLWLVGAVFFFRILEMDTRKGYPYESWDEIATYNSAVSIHTEASGRVYSYGGLNTLQQVLANWIHQHFDPIGRAHPPVRYSNNALASLGDPDLGIKPKTWVGMDHHYFRGLTDHRPIFLSRKIHLLVFAILFFGLGGFLIWRNPSSGVISLLFLSYLASPEVVDGVEKALPGLQNSILVLFVILLAGEAIKRSSVRWLMGAIAVYAISLNIKIDTLALLAPLGCVSLLLAWRLKSTWTDRIKLLGAIGAFTVFAFFAFRVSMWLRGHPELAPQYATLRGFSSGHVDPWVNLKVFEGLVRSNGFVPFDWASSLPVGTLIYLGTITSLMVGFFVFRDPDLLSFGATSIFLWSLLILRASSVGIQSRYFLYSFVLGQFGAALLLGRMTRAFRSEIRALAIGIVICICGATAHSGWALRNRILAQGAVYKAFDGLDPHHNFNIATEKAMDLFKGGRFRRMILIDQHSYLDVRRFWEQGIQPVLINQRNYTRVLGEVALSLKQPSLPILVLFSPGTIHQWNDSFSGPDWTSEEKALYSIYQKHIRQLPLIEAVGHGQRELLDPGPVRETSPMEIRRWDASGLTK